MTFIPEKFYFDPISKITYLCVWENVDSVEFIYWDDEDNKFCLIAEDTIKLDHLMLKDQQE